MAKFTISSRRDLVMKRYVLLLLLTLPAASVFAEEGTPTFVQSHGQLSVQGTQLVDAQDEPIVPSSCVV